MPDFREQVQVSLGAAYTIERELGGGGMSRVFVARDAALRRDVVVKVLPPDLVAGVNVERFRREILVAAGLQHPHIVPVLASGETDGLPWFSMPFVQGESLRQRLVSGPLPIPEAIGILREVAKALAYAHERGVVHRDIKPDNVLLTGGTAMVTDFGIAKALSASRTSDDPSGTHGGLTQVGTSIGTPMYMAPEQAAADPGTDARADLYSFGCLAYELLAGRPPFVGMSPQKLLAAHMGERPSQIVELRPDTPPVLAELVMRCLEKEPERRPSSAADVVRLLDSATTTSGTTGATSAALLGGRVRLRVALALWAVVFFAAWILAKAAIVGIGLPSWVLPGALGVAALGLPVILFTAFVQRTANRAVTRTPTLTPGGTREAHSTIVAIAMKASPHVSWRRTTRGGIIAFGLFVLGIGAFMALRAFGIGPAGSLLAAGVMNDRDRLLVADFSTPGGDSVLARAVTEAIRTDLGQSNVIRLVPASVVSQTLGLMQKAPGTHVDTGVARVIAVRAGVKAVLGGDVSALGSSYLLTARLIAPSSGDVLAAFRETAADQRDLVPAVERLSRALRAKVGESLRRIQGDPPLTEVTTSSLEALRLYAEGVHVGDDLGDVPRGKALLLEAVQRDSTFAMAWRKLGSWSNNVGEAVAETYAKKAVDNASHLPSSERYLAIASYHTTAGAGYDPDQAIAALRRIIDTDSTAVMATSNAAIQYAERGKNDSAIMLARRVAGDNAFAAYHLAIMELRAGHAGQSESLLAVAHQRAPAFPYRRGFDFIEEYGLGRFEAAEAVARARPTPLTLSLLAAQEMTLGRYDAAEATLRQATDSAMSQGDSTSALAARIGASWIESMVRSRPAIAAAGLQAAERQIPLDRLPLSRRPYYQLAAAYAVAGRPDRATQLIHEADRNYSRGLSLWYREAGIIAKGLTALAAARPRDAVAALREPVSFGGLSPRDINAGGVWSPEPFLGLAYDRAGEPDSARAALERYVSIVGTARVFTDALVRGQSLQRLGELYEAKGDRQAAAKYYAQLLDLWKNADPVLKPRIDDVRKRLAHLSDVERK